MAEQPIYMDLSASGGPARITVEQLTRYAVRAKTKVKRTSRGWSMLSKIEVLALAWFADLFLDDGEVAAPPDPQPQPEPISNV